MKKVTVVVACHKPFDPPKDELYLPVQAGRAINDDIGFVGDNTGDNISSKNPNYCELTVLYWAVKNLDADYIGLAHYRRHFSADKKNILTYAEANKLLDKADVILPSKRKYYIENLYDHYVHTLQPEPLDIALKVIEQKYPSYMPSVKRLHKRTSAHMFNMMIMRSDLLCNYCDWLFDILGEVEKQVACDDMSSFDARFYGRISELLLDVWLETNNISYVETPFVYLGKVNQLGKIYDFLAAKLFKKKYTKSR